MIIELKSMHQTGKKIFRELENCLLQASSPFLRMFSLLSGIYFPIYTHFRMSSMTSFSLDHSKFWFSGNGLNGCELKSRHQTGKKIFRETEKLLVTCKFSFSQNIFFVFWYIFSNLHILSNVICNLFQFGPV